MDWISVNDKLPEIDNDGNSEDVLIAIRYSYDEPTEPHTICCGYLIENDWWSYTEHDCHKIGESRIPNLWSGDKVEYWMPLPQGPKLKTV